MSVTQIDPKSVEVLTEWCRNKPEDAAIEILAMQALVRQDEEKAGGYCQCGRWVSDE